MNSMQKAEKYRDEFNPQIVRDATNRFNEIGKKGYFQEMINLPYNTQDVLQRAKLWIIDNFLKVRKGEYVVDVGCGVGNDCYRFASLGCVVVGLDKDETKMKFCKFLQDTYGGIKVRFVLGSTINIRFPDKFFDIVYSSMLIEHLRSPFDGLQEMARISKYMCGIIHMGEKEEDNPYHTRFLKLENVKHLLDGCLEKGYVLDTIDEIVFAVFYGKVKGKRIPNKSFGEIISDDLQLPSARWAVKDTYTGIVNLDKVECIFVPVSEFSKQIVEDYIDCIKMFGRKAVEDDLNLIRLLYFPKEDKYMVYRDGSHRLYALKSTGHIVKEFKAEITELRAI